MEDWVEIIPAESSDSTMINWDEQDTLEGVYQLKKENVGANNSNVYTLKTKDGNVSFWGTSVLDDRMEEVQIGEKVKIVYTGKKTGSAGRSYRTFKVYHMASAKAKVDETPLEDIDIPF